MARQQTVLTILFASPSDVSEELEIAVEIVKEFNNTWSRQLGVTLEILRWETDVTPGVASDPQQVINEGLPSYDILLSVMWTRVGTPTPRAESGTIEEFDRAYSRFQEAPDQLQILIYFSMVPAEPQSIDAVQLGKVHKFRERVSTSGVLYSNFRAREEFATKLRTDLARLVQSWKGGWTPPGGGSPSTKSHQSEPTLPKETGEAAAAIPIDTKSDPTSEEEESEGYIDLIEAAETSIERAVTAVNEISVAIELLGENISKKSKMITELGEQGQSKAKVVKHHINLAAADMAAFADTISQVVPIFASETANSLNSLSKAAIIGADFSADAQPLNQALDGVESMQEGILKGRGPTAELRSSISNLPRMTTEFQRARKKTLAALDSFDRALQDGLELSEQVKTTLRRIASSAEIPVLDESVKPTDVVVVPQGLGWSVLQGGKLAAGVHRTQDSAIEAGRVLAAKRESELVILGEDGSITRE